MSTPAASSVRSLHSSNFLPNIGYEGPRHAADDRQLRFVHLQPGPILWRARRRRARRAQRRDLARPDLRDEAGADLYFARTVFADAGRHFAVASGAFRRQHADTRRLPWTSGDWPGLRRQGRARAPVDAWQDRVDRTQGCRRLCRLAHAIYRDPLSLTRGRARIVACLSGSHCLDGRRRDHGSAPQDAGGRRCAVPSGIDRDRTRSSVAAEFFAAALNVNRLVFAPPSNRQRASARTTIIVENTWLFPRPRPSHVASNTARSSTMKCWRCGAG